MPSKQKLWQYPGSGAVGVTVRSKPTTLQYPLPELWGLLKRAPVIPSTKPWSCLFGMGQSAAGQKKMKRSIGQIGAVGSEGNRPGPGNTAGDLPPRLLVSHTKSWTWDPGRSEVRRVAEDIAGWVCRDVFLDPATAKPLSLSADGVPFTKTHSLFLVNISFRAGTCARRHSLDSMWQVLLWSLRFAVLGVMPLGKHDSASWLPSDGRGRGGLERCPEPARPS